MACLSLLFTVLISSYIIGDSPAFRLAVHAFVGRGRWLCGGDRLPAGGVVDKLFLPLLAGSPLDRLLMLFPLLMSVLLLAKMSPSLEWLGRPVVAFLVGVGTATAVAGAVLGTLFPQIQASAGLFGQGAGASSPARSSCSAAITTLAYFQFTVGKASAGRRGRLMSLLALLGQVFIAIALGAVFAGVLAAALTASRRPHSIHRPVPDLLLR